MSRKKRLILIVIGIVGTLLAAFAARNSGQASVPTNEAYKAQERVEKQDREEQDEKGEGTEEREKRVLLSGEDQEKFGIEVDTAGPGKLDVHLTFPAEIAVNSDQTAQIVPRLTGIVSEVRKNIGDTVTAGEVMAVIESRELAEAKAKYLAALSRMDLAQTNFNRFDRLFKQEAIAEKQFLEVKNAFEEAQIELRSAKQKLLAMGVSSDYFKDPLNHPDESLTRYEILAPFTGIVLSKRMTLGEMRLYRR